LASRHLASRASDDCGRSRQGISYQGRLSSPTRCSSGNLRGLVQDDLATLPGAGS
jgi:hypothetical protein